MDKQLLVPVYLNQRLVFDLLAMLQGGLSMVTAVSQTTNKSQDTKREAGTSFGITDTLATLLKVDLSGKKISSAATAVAEATSEERVHTPASLLYQLRNKLKEIEAVLALNNDRQVKAGDFIEFEASLLKNPVLEAIDGMSRLMDIAILFEDEPKQTSKGKRICASNESKKIKDQMDKFSESLKFGNTIDLITSKLNNGITAVVTLEKSSLNDPLMSDLVDGKFRVLGKVIRNISEPQESISLVRNNALSNLPQHMLVQLGTLVGALGTEHGFAVPEIRWEIKAPAIQVLPIAIYA
ncbi:hypothetical protein LL962_17825 [Xanthomonas sp. NCPPB 1067]|uniref:DUF6414 family protein n=1 Tax=Xanthomonas TaxID=338 RepID=UPI001E366ABA|nr:MULTISPECIES: hypothetical protein [Xanthomonas]MCC4588936.1 hypothetical protein [Xanthomonas sp. NCPPB 1067]MCD0277676.1 hypothetical protein [Xanthomonas melonis]